MAICGQKRQFAGFLPTYGGWPVIPLSSYDLDWGTDIYWLWVDGLDPDVHRPVPLIVERQRHVEFGDGHELTVHYCVNFFNHVWEHNNGAVFDGDGEDTDGDGAGDGGMCQAFLDNSDRILLSLVFS